MTIDEFKQTCISLSMQHFGCEVELLWCDQTRYHLRLRAETGSEAEYWVENEEIVAEYYS